MYKKLLILLALLFTNNSFAQNNVTVSWNANPETFQLGCETGTVNMTAGSNIVSGSPNPLFTLADVGKQILIFGAGDGSSNLLTTVTSFINGTSVTVFQMAATSVNNARYELVPDDIAGYKVFWGQVSGNYSNSLVVGNVLSHTINNLANGTWYFAAKAYDGCGNESDFSNEASKTFILNIPNISISNLVTNTSNNFGPEHPVSQLFDGCTDGSVACTSGNGTINSFWVEFDLQQKYSLSMARLFGDNEGVWVSSSWSLQYKQNVSDPWSSGFTNINALFNNWSEQSVSAIARFVRVEVFGNVNPANSGTQARELELYGTALDTPNVPLQLTIR